MKLPGDARGFAQVIARRHNEGQYKIRGVSGDGSDLLDAESLNSVENESLAGT